MRAAADLCLRAGRADPTPKRTTREKQDYGPSLRTRCSKCGVRSRVKSREAHPDLGPKYERQTFVCPKCGAVDIRDVHTPDAG
jgi:predicted RNA-binding Zn-ribbon protein involved in translation (DUF1610 family)